MQRAGVWVYIIILLAWCLWQNNGVPFCLEVAVTTVTRMTFAAKWKGGCFSLKFVVSRPFFFLTY